MDMQEWIAQNDQRVQNMLNQQEKDPAHNRHGGLPDRFGIFHPMSTASMVQYFAAAYVAPSSSFYRHGGLAGAMQDAIQCLLRMQHDDGTIDLLSTNFHSTPDTGFVVEPLCIAYSLLDKSQENSILPLLESFLLKAGEALSTGGIHTPNHRWVVCMALARLHHLFPDTRYIRRIEEWLHEKIDIDPDGQYTERSTHIYSPLTNRCLITLAKLLHRPGLYDPVRKNLEMTLFYLHPNGELVTEASGRQDQFTVGKLDPYYYSYRFMALHDKHPVFSAAVHFMEQNADPQSLSANLPLFLEDPALQKILPEPSMLPSHYQKYFPYSKLVRIRRKEVDATILAENSTFFTFSNNKAVLQAVRLASAFFGKGQMVASKLFYFQEGIRLEQELEGPYFQPFPVEDLPSDGDWHKMPRIKRPQSEVQYLRSVITIKEIQEAQFTLQFDVQGTANIPLAIELAFRKGGELSGVDAIPDIPHSWLLSKGQAIYSFAGSTIKFGPGQVEHRWTQLRGGLPKLDAESVYITGYTPFKFELYIR